MKDDNVKILGAVAICVLLYLLMKKNKMATAAPRPLAAPAQARGPAQSQRVSQSTKETVMTMLEDTFGMSLSMKEPNEDKHILVGRFDACPAGHVIAKQASPTDRTGA